MLLRLVIATPIAVALALILFLMATVLLKYVIFPAMAFIVRI